MDNLFKALADQSRRYLLDQLRQRDGLTLGELCKELEMTRQAVSKHLLILEEANLVVCLREGRLKRHYLNPIPIQQIAHRWVEQFRDTQVNALLTLKQNLENSDD
tara:strand:- start:9121 stop:9435 length:315 start_codon:yes stop_codon:yes gene_type:complete